MSDLQKTHVYYVGLGAYYRLPYLAQPYPEFKTLRARHEGINDMDVVPHGPLIPALLPALIFEPAPILAAEEGPRPERVPEQHNTPRDPSDSISLWNLPKELADQFDLLNVMGP